MDNKKIAEALRLLADSLNQLSNAVATTETSKPEEPEQIPIPEEAPVEQPKVEAPPVDREEPKEAEKTYELIDVRTRATSAVRAGKSDTLRKILSELGAAKLSDLKEADQFAEFMRKADKEGI